jgi:hypothetical protein
MTMRWSGGEILLKSDGRTVGQSDGKAREVPFDRRRRIIAVQRGQ